MKNFSLSTRLPNLRLARSTDFLPGIGLINYQLSLGDFLALVSTFKLLLKVDTSIDVQASCVEGLMNNTSR